MEGLNWHHRIDEISKDSRSYSRAGDANERAHLAELLNLLSCDAVSASYTLKALENDAIALKGSLRAGGQQPCVVTLDPVPFDIREDFDVVFQRRTETQVQDGQDELEEYEVSSVQDIETYSGSVIDVGRVVFDHFSASLDPYPRAPGAKLEASVEGERVESTTHPFAALEKLKRNS